MALQVANVTAAHISSMFLNFVVVILINKIFVNLDTLILGCCDELLRLGHCDDLRRCKKTREPCDGIGSPP